MRTRGYKTFSILLLVIMVINLFTSSSIKVNADSSNLTSVLTSNIPESSGIIENGVITYTIDITNNEQTSMNSIPVTIDIPSTTKYVPNSSYINDVIVNDSVYDGVSKLNFKMDLNPAESKKISFNVKVQVGAIGNVDMSPSVNGTKINTLSHPILKISKACIPDQNVEVIENQKIIFRTVIENTSDKPVTNVTFSANISHDNNTILQVFGYNRGDYNIQNAAGTIAQPKDYYDYFYGYFFDTKPILEKSKIADSENGPYIISKKFDQINPGNKQAITYDYYVYAKQFSSSTLVKDSISINGQETAPLQLNLTNNPFTSDKPVDKKIYNGDTIKYTLKILNSQDINKLSLAELYIPNGTSYVENSGTQGALENGAIVTFTKIDNKLSFKIKNMPLDEVTEISYTVKINEDTQSPIVNENSTLDGFKLDTITHYLGEFNILKCGYTFNEPTNLPVSRGSDLTFGYYVENKSNEQVNNVVFTVPISEQFVLNPLSLQANINIINGTQSFIASDLYYYTYDQLVALGPLTVIFDIGSIEAGSRFSNDSFGLKVKVKNDAKGELIHEPYAIIGGNESTKSSCEKLTYNIQSLSYVDINSNPEPTNIVNRDKSKIDGNGSPLYKDNEIEYILKTEQGTLNDIQKFTIYSLIPAGSTYIEGSSNVMYSDGNGEPAYDFDSTTNSGKYSWTIYNKENDRPIEIHFKVRVNEYIGQIENYATIQVFANGTDTVLDGSESRYISHKIIKDSPSKVTVSSQTLLDDKNNPLTQIPQNDENGLNLKDAEFVITLCDEDGNEYSGQMKAGGDSITFIGLPYDKLFTVSESGMEGTKFTSTNLPSNQFMLEDVDGKREINFTIESKYTKSNGFSSQLSKDNFISLPNTDYTSLLLYQLQWLSNIQLQNGAIPKTDEKLNKNDDSNLRYSVSPYFSIEAAKAFLLHPDYYKNAKAYIEWHFNHINMSEDLYKLEGTIYDYFYDIQGNEYLPTPNSETGLDVYDSVDSYAAMFMDLLIKYYDATGDKTIIINNSDKIDKIFNVLQEMFNTVPGDSNSILTYAKSNYKIQYLMDNVEVYHGFNALKRIYGEILENPSQAYVSILMGGIYNGIENHLWNKVTQTYDYAYKNNSDITHFYPGAVAQLFPILLDTIPPESDKAKKLYDEFCNNYPNWTSMNGENPVGTFVNDTGYPWTILSIVAVKMKDYERAKKCFENIQTQYREHSNPFPILCHESGDAALAMYNFMKDYYLDINSKFPELTKYQNPYGY